MTDTARARKLADRVREVVAEALEKRIKDPRLGFITVTDSRMTNDLQHATVFYTVFGDEIEQASSAAALESAKGVLRSELGRRLGIRLTPTLDFVQDALLENARHMEELVREARERDAQLAALAQGASHAGDPDPYKRPADETADLDEDEDDDQDDAGTGEGPAEPVGP